MDISTFPAPLLSRVDGTTWHKDDIGCTSAEVYHLTYPDHTGYYLKRVGVEHPWEMRELAHESGVLAWLQGKLPVPEVAYAGLDTTARYQLTTEIAGVVACDPVLRGFYADVIRVLATGLRRIHSIPIENCPFDQGLDAKLASARYRIANGLIDSTTFEDGHRTHSPADILAQLEQTAPAHQYLVFTHGDYCLPNVLLDPLTLTLTGVIDWGRAGVADRYQDLGIAARSVGFNLGDEWIAPFLEAYGEAEPDRRKIEYFILLDELF